MTETRRTLLRVKAKFRAFLAPLLFLIRTKQVRDVKSIYRIQNFTAVLDD
jgi:hypothetical protein